MPPPVFRHRLVEAARAAGRRIVLPEGDEPRTLRAAAICAEREIANCVLWAIPGASALLLSRTGSNCPPRLELVDPDSIRSAYIEPMVERRKAKGLTALQAEKALEDTVVLGTMMLAEGHVDGLVSGAVHTTANTVLPGVATHQDRAGIDHRVQRLLHADARSGPGLRRLRHQSRSVGRGTRRDRHPVGGERRRFRHRPARRDDLLLDRRFADRGGCRQRSAKRPGIVRQRRPDIVVDGPIQYDAASVESVGRQKAPVSPLGGHANVFIFPDLNTGNTTYKAVQRSRDVVSVGPMLQGLRKPVNDLSRGALVDDIVYTIALTAIQAQAQDAAAKEPLFENPGAAADASLVASERAAE